MKYRAFISDTILRPTGEVCRGKKFQILSLSQRGTNHLASYAVHLFEWNAYLGEDERRGRRIVGGENLTKYASCR